ncbi:MAG: RHS repeat-associated core domain-containing protein [Chloroflexota bacterium]
MSPTVTISAQSSGLDITLSWAASDKQSGLESCSVAVKVGDGSEQPLSTDCTGSMIYPGTQDVEHLFTFSATDKVSNRNDSSDSATPNSVTKYYYLGADRVAMRNGDGVFYLHSDHLGSTSLTTDENGEVVSEKRYYPFGEERFSGGTQVTDWAFTGQRLDAGFGLIDYNARFYSPRIGRFISPDTLIPDLTSSQDWNRYGYVKNNPLTYQDSSGNFAFLPWLLKAGTEAAVDAMVQAAFSYYFDPEITSIDQAIGEISWSQVAWAGATGLMPGSGLAKSAAVAVGDVLINFAELGDDYTVEQALQDFIISVGSELVGKKAGELVEKYGPEAFETGLKKLGLSGGCSFSSDTLVLTDIGLRPIADLIVGDIVYAYNEKTGKFGWYPVTATFAHLDPEIVLLTIDGEVIETTPEHPFMIMEAAPWLAVSQVDERWVAAGNLSVGNDVLNSNASTGNVESFAVVAVERWMYNITVSEANTFFVGYGEWLVHNSCDEELIDDFLRNQGRIVEINPLEGVEGAGRQGDRYIDGILTEYKTLAPGATSNRIKNVVNNSIRKGGQARHIIIDARSSGLTLDEATRGIGRAFGISRGLVDVIEIIGEDFHLVETAQ